MTKTYLVRTDAELKRDFDEILGEKLKNRTIKKKDATYPRVTKAIRRLGDWKDIKRRIIEAEFKDE